LLDRIDALRQRPQSGDHRAMRLGRFLYRAARLSRDVDAVEKTAATGNPRYVARRARNKWWGEL